MQFRVWLGSSLLALSLAACGGGGGGGDGGEAPPSGGGFLAPQPFSVTGTWRAMGLAGVYEVSINDNGVIQFARPDDVKGPIGRMTLAGGGIQRGSDGAYIFRSGFVVGGVPLDITLYRVDANTMAGLILASRNGSLRLAPVILTRHWAKDLNALPGDWAISSLACLYEQSKGQCESALSATQVSAYEAWRVPARLSATQFLTCAENEPASPSDCAPENLKGVAVTNLGAGDFEFSGERAFMFHVGGDDLIFGHGREGQTDVLTYMDLMAREQALAPEAFNGVWRVAAGNGRAGTATVNGNGVTMTLDGRAPINGTLTRNQPTRSISVLQLDGQAHPSYWVGTEKLALISGNDEYYLLHRQ